MTTDDEQRTKGGVLKLTLSAAKEHAARRGHPSVYRDDLAEPPPDNLPAGEEADVVDARGNFVGRGLLSGGGRVVCRLYTRRREPLDRDFFRKRILAAQQLRRSLNLPSKNTDGYRAVFAEADRLPGLIVDRYADYLVIQTGTTGLDQRKEMLADVLAEVFSPAGVCERNDMPLRQREKLPSVRGWLHGQAAGPITIRENGLVYEVDLLGAMKTGHFFDQRENRLLLERICRGKQVLDMFSCTGGFGLTAAKHGATSVLSVDASQQALDAARRNAEMNELAEQIAYQTGDGFEVLQELERGPKKFDVIVLDPPAFAKSKAHAERAGRAYRDLNARALRMLPMGGFLLTCSCSQQISRREFRRLIADAATEARRAVRLAAEGSAGRDHPVLLNVPETDYLKCLLVQTVDKW